MSPRPSLILPTLALLLLAGLYFCTRILDTTAAGELFSGESSEVAAGDGDGLLSIAPDGQAEGSGSHREQVIVPPAFVEEEQEGAALEEQETGPRLFGRVVRSSGVGIAGARVIVREANSWLAVPADVEEMTALSWRGTIYEATSDEEGLFVLHNVDPGDIALAIQADGFSPLTRMRIPVPVHEEYDLGRFLLELGVKLSGKVTGPRGKPVEGVQVLRAVSPESGSLRLDLPGHGIPTAVTDAEGLFEVNCLPAGAWHLIFDHPDYRIAELKGRTEPIGQSEPGLQVMLDAGLTIEGRVEGIDPIAEGPLRITARRDREQRSGAADDVAGAEKYRARHAMVEADGSFVLAGLAPGQQYKLRMYKLRAPEEDDPPGLPERWKHVRGLDDKLELAGAKQVVLEYRAEASIAFEVRSASSAKALEQFVVNISGSGLGGGGLLEQEGSDDPKQSFPGGKVLFAGLRPSEEGVSATIRVRAQGFVDFEKRNVMLRPGDELELGEVKLEPAKLVTVKVVDKQSGEPIEGAHVVLAKGGASDSLDRWVNRTERRSWGDKQVRDGFTDSEGRARITAWPEAICVLKAAADGYLAADEERSVAPHAEEVVFELDLGARVTVRILDGESNPVAGMFVEHTAENSASDNQNRWFFNNSGAPEEKSNEQGEVVFKKLGKGKHTFQVLEKRNNWGGGGESAGHEAEGEVYLDLGEEAELVLRVAARGGYIATLLESGEPLAGALAKLTPVEGGSKRNGWWFSAGQEDPRSRISDHSGRVHFKQLKVGRYNLKVTHPDRRMSIQREILVQREPIEEILDLGLATIEGRVTDQDGEPIRRVSITIQEKDRDGDYSSGDYRVRITEDAEGDADWDYDQVSQWSIKTDENGEYVLRGVRPECALRMHLSNTYVVPVARELQPLGAVEYLTGIDFVMERAGALRVEVQGYSDSSRRLNLVLEREKPAVEGQEPTVESRSTNLRSWRPSTTIRSVRAGTWRLKLFVDKAQEPILERDVEVQISETTHVTLQL